MSPLHRWFLFNATYSSTVREEKSLVMQIRYLSSDEQEIETVASWHHHEWRHLAPGDTLDARIERIARRAHRTQIPLTVVAIEDELLGTASLIELDMDTHPELTPWLASVYVAPPHRGQGIGKQLCRHVLTRTRELGYPTCYLFTPSEEHWYRRQGWGLIQHEPYRGENVAVMRYDF
jgi:predicted N-acetyltransferase YhbS